MRRALVAFAAVVSWGCAAGPEASLRADPTVATLAAALRSGDAPAIVAATGHAQPEVEVALAASGAELRALGETLALATVEPEARVTLADGAVLVLARDGESWRVDRGVLGRPSLSRPIDAVVAFHDALARARVEGVLAVLARAPREELSTELNRWLEGTADPDAVQISVQGETAIAITPTGERLELVRESGEWHVVSF